MSLRINAKLKAHVKTVAGVRSIILEVDALEGLVSLTRWQRTYLVATKKDTAKFKALVEVTQHSKTGTTCGYWVLRGLAKLERLAGA
jgi:hypothetical protein